MQYLPTIGWFKKILQAENVLVEQHENFVKSTGRNRSAIVGANGLQLLTIPLAGGRDNHRAYSQVGIAYQADWQSNHWQSIVSAYGSTPYFEHYAFKLQPFYEKRIDSLFDFNLQLLKVLLKMLKTEREIQFTGSYAKTVEGLTDLRSGRKNDEVPMPPYYQIFSHKHGFIPNLSIIDLIFHKGPEAKEYIMNI